MGSPFSRLSLAAVSIIAAALIFGFLAGGIVIHRFETTSQTSTSQQHQQEEQEQPEKDNEQADKDDKGETPKKPKSNHATGARTTEPDDN